MGTRAHLVGRSAEFATDGAPAAGAASSSGVDADRDVVRLGLCHRSLSRLDYGCGVIPTVAVWSCDSSDPSTIRKDEIRRRRHPAPYPSSELSRRSISQGAKGSRRCLRG